MVKLKRRANDGRGRLPFWLVFGGATFLLCAINRKLLGSISSAEFDFELATRQSGGFFNDIPSKQWKLLQHIVAIHNNHKYPDEPLTHHPWKDKRKLKYLSSYPAWYQTVSDSTCQIWRLKLSFVDQL